MARIQSNLAYDLPNYDDDYYDYDNEYEYAPPQEQPQNNIQHKANANKKSPIFPLIEILVPAIVAVVVLAGVISNQIDMSRLTAEQSKMSAQLSQLQDECTNLEAQLAARTSVTAVEDYAENTLGLTKLDKSQVEFVEVPVDSVSEVVKKEEKGFFASIKDWFESVKEYLGIE